MAEGPKRRLLGLWLARLIFILCLCSVAAILGKLSFIFLDESETVLAEMHYRAIADRALTTSKGIVSRKRLATVTLASVASYANPDAEKWPFVHIPGYEAQAMSIIRTSLSREMSFSPIVRPDQRQSFEDYAYNYYYFERIPSFPNGTATSPFGRGVWALTTQPDGQQPERYHDVNGATAYNSPNLIFVPMLHHSSGPHQCLMMNFHSEETRGRAIDEVIACSERRAQGGPAECGTITDMLPMINDETGEGPGAWFMQPVYPARNPLTLTGFVFSSVVWDEILQNVFAPDVSGVDLVVRTQNQTYTYGVRLGVPYLKGIGDLHTAYDELRQKISLTGSGQFSANTPNYTLELYPTDEFFDGYRTTNPRVVSVGSVCIVIAMAALFFMYDFFVRKEFFAASELLEAKRSFVRFISHEVRTPLNTVCMGLSLIQEEIGTVCPSSYTTIPNHPCPGDLHKASPELAEHDECVDVQKTDLSDWIVLTGEVLDNAQSAVNVLNDLLNYDKITSRTLQLDLSIVHIWTLLEQTVAEFKLAAKEKDVELSLQFQDLAFASTLNLGSRTNILKPEVSACRVVGDEVKISQILRNLVSNALKFTPAEGRVTVRVKKTPSPQGNTSTKEFTLSDGDHFSACLAGDAVIEVIDTGAGMTKEQLSVVFDDGTQFNANSLQAGGGSGLGLCIAKGIAEQHDGALTVRSSGLGQGTTFSLALPLYQIPEVATSVTWHGEEKEADPPSFHTESLSLRILVVDDSRSNVRLLSRLLRNRGHDCVEAGDGQEAVDLVQEALESDLRFDSILLDFEMPTMNGPTACKKIREMGCTSFVAGITGNVLPDDVAHFRECGADVVLPKPFKIGELEQHWVDFKLLPAL